MSQLQDRIASIVHAFGDAERKDSVRALAQDVGALEARLAELEAENKALRDRVAGLETVLDAAMNCLREATGAVMRLTPLEAEAKQAREDEAWAHDKIMPVDFAPVDSGWEAGWWDGEKKISATAPTIHAALRALRAKVEGGAR